MADDESAVVEAPVAVASVAVPVAKTEDRRLKADEEADAEATAAWQ